MADEIKRYTATSQSVIIHIDDLTTGDGMDGLDHTTIALYSALDNADPVVISLSAESSANTWGSNQIAEVDAANAKGDYRVHLANALIPASTSLRRRITGVVTGGKVQPLNIHFVAYDPTVVAPATLTSDYDGAKYTGAGGKVIDV